jgi:hypothetical protein
MHAKSGAVSRAAWAAAEPFGNVHFHRRGYLMARYRRSIGRVPPKSRSGMEIPGSGRQQERLLVWLPCLACPSRGPEEW